ncbi:MAG: ATP-binding protein [Bacteroidales bacterium]|nr:ATP-binding protein [Bacteroidales bacterium]
MIQKLTIKNFLSFKDEVTFSFEASNDRFAEDYQVVKINDNTRLLRFAIVYGYNASGKSNLLYAFDFLYHFWFNSTKDPDQATQVEPFKLDQISVTKPTMFDLIFWVSKTKYRYQLELDRNQVYLEKLSYYENTQPTMLFKRFLDNNRSVIEFGSSSKLKVSEAVRETIELNCLKNMSFFAARRKVNAIIPFVDTATDYLIKNFIEMIAPDTKLTNYALRKIVDDNELTSYLVNFLNAVDFNITDIKTNVTKKPIPNDLFESLFANDVAANLKKYVSDVNVSDKAFYTKIDAFFEHTVENENGKESYQFKLGKDKESQGTIRIFGMEAALYNALKKNAFLAIDEIETSLHPKLLERMIFEFLKANSTSQLIVTTHNDGLLDLINNLIRKDSVWFTEKKKSGVTDLYKLTDFRGVNRLSSIREAYRNKRFGATMN